MHTALFNRKELIKAMEIAVIHAATDDLRPVLNRVNFLKWDDSSVAVVGTDGYRLSITMIKPSNSNFVNCGIDLKDAKAAIKHLKTLKHLTDVPLKVESDTMLIPVQRLKPFCGRIHEYETVDKEIDIHRINLAGVEYVSNVGTLPNVKGIIPDTYNLPSARVDSAVMLYTLYNPLYVEQVAARKDAVKALELQPNRNTKWNRLDVEKLYRVTTLYIHNLINPAKDVMSHFESVYLNDTFKALKDSHEVTRVYLTSADQPLLYIVSGATQVVIMPRKPHDLTNKLEDMKSITFNLYS